MLAYGPAIHDRATPRFVARQEKGLPVLLAPADLVDFAPQIDASPAILALFKDVLGQVDLGMPEVAHKALIAQIGKVVEAFVDAPRGPAIDMDQVPLQLIVSVSMSVCGSLSLCVFRVVSVSVCVSVCVLM